MPAVGKITLDAKEYEAMLARVQKSTAAATNKMSQNVGDISKDASKAKSALNALGGAASSAGGAIGKLGSVISAVSAGPMAIMIAGLGAMVSAAVYAFDQLTLSAEEYAQKSAIAAERANKAWSKQQKQHGEDMGYMDRLVELSRKERLSNEAKTEAAELISLLTSRYGDLGVSIDQVTGKIVGADAAQQRMLERMRQQQIKMLDIRLRAQKQSIDAEIKKSGHKLAFDYYDYDKKTRRNPRTGKLQYVKTEKDTEGKIAYFQRRLEHMSSSGDIAQFSRIIEMLYQQLELEEQQKNIREWSTSPGARKASDRAQKKTDYLEAQKQELQYQRLLLAGEYRKAEIVKLINDLKKQGIELTEEEARKMVEERAAYRKEKYLADQREADAPKQLRNDGKSFKEVEVLRLINDLKKQGIELTEEEARKMVEERMALGRDTHYRETREQLEHQLLVERMLLKGETDRARKIEIINEFIRRGYEVQMGQINKILELRKQLGSVDLAKGRKDEYKSLYERALRAANRGREADEYSALERARTRKGSELTGSERDATLKLVELTRKLARLEGGPDLGRMTIQANSLTARGGGGGKAVETANERIQRSIADRAQRANDLLRQIKDKIGQTSGITGYSSF